MLWLILATVYFVGLHIFVAGTGLRDVLIERLGARPYRGLFALASLVGLIALASAYGHAPYVGLWGQVYGGRAIAGALMLVAFAFIVLGLLTPNPAVLKHAGLLDEADPARGILRVSRHPFLAGVVIWAVVHLVYNGDVASLIFFSSFLILVLFGARSIDKKQHRLHGERWLDYEKKTSIVPFMAIVQRRSGLRIRDFVWWHLVIVVLVYMAFLHAHVWLFGVSPLGV